MKKLFLKRFLVIFSLAFVSSLFVAGTGFAAMPSELLSSFESSANYDQVNKDLMTNLEKAKEWDESATLGRFFISDVLEGDGIYYDFTYIGLNKENEALHASPNLSHEWQTEIVEREKAMRNGIYRVGLKLRDLIPAMKKDKNLMPLLNRLLKNADVVSFSLEKNWDNQLFWTIAFADENEKGVVTTYLVTVSAQETTNPIFHVLRNPKVITN